MRDDDRLQTRPLCTLDATRLTPCLDPPTTVLIRRPPEEQNACAPRCQALQPWHRTGQRKPLTPFLPFRSSSKCRPLQTVSLSGAGPQGRPPNVGTRNSYGVILEIRVYQLASEVRVAPQLPIGAARYCDSVQVCPMNSDA